MFFAVTVTVEPLAIVTLLWESSAFREWSAIWAEDSSSAIAQVAPARSEGLLTAFPSPGTLSLPLPSGPQSYVKA